MWIVVITSVFIAVVIEAIITLFGHSPDPHLEKLGWAGEAITGIAAVSALIGLLYQSHKDETDIAFEIMDRFADNVIPILGVIENDIIRIDKTFKFPTGRIETMWLRNYLADDVERKAQKLWKILYGNGILSKVRAFLAELELFAGKINFLNISGNPAFVIVKQTYVEIVESYAIVILGIGLNGESAYYREIIKLYNTWKDDGIVRDWEKQLENETTAAIEQRRKRTL